MDEDSRPKAKFRDLALFGFVAGVLTVVLVVLIVA